MSSGARLRRSPHIVSYWRNGQLIYQNYLSGISISASPLCTVVLDFFERWRRPGELTAYMGGFSPVSVRRSLRLLREFTFLESEGQPDERSRAMRAWSPWFPEASFFHFATKDVPYQVELEVERRTIRNFLRRQPLPPFFKRYPNAPLISLPSMKLPTNSEFLRVLFARRTHRNFSLRKLPLETLGHLLQLTWGVSRYEEVELLGRVPMKTSPSAGCCHPIEVYVAALRVEGLPQGLYHYASNRNCLECVRKLPMKQRLLRYLCGQQWFVRAPATLLMTAVFPRTLWKYRFSRSYRSVLLDAGHLCQTFCLAATWLGLAPFCTMALADSLIERDMEIDGITESVLYAAGVGWPAK
jgi:SagB-type dehydrogenase family enzyme